MYQQLNHRNSALSLQYTYKIRTAMKSTLYYQVVESRKVYRQQMD